MAAMGESGRACSGFFHALLMATLRFARRVWFDTTVRFQNGSFGFASSHPSAAIAPTRRAQRGVANQKMLKKALRNTRLPSALSPVARFFTSLRLFEFRLRALEESSRNLYQNI
jgi:hypothetical protein